MATYVPADSLAFLEINDLPRVVDGITNTDAWKTLSVPANATLNLGASRWLVGLARWTGIGPVDAVLLARSQFAVSFLELDSSDAGTSLNIKPLFALVIETHTTQYRMRPALERRIEEFARREYGQPGLERKAIDGVEFMEWSSPDGTRRIVAAFVATLAIIGNDEQPVRACMAVRRGTRPSLAGSKLLNEMRTNPGLKDAPLFGFATGAGLKAFAIATAPYVFDSAVTRTNGPQVLAGVIPKIVDGVAWAPHFVDGAVEDLYVSSFTEGVVQQLRDGLTPERPPDLGSVNLLPPGTYSLTQYNLREPVVAWRAMIAAISSHVDILSAVAAPRLLASFVKPYGVDDPEVFLAAVGPQITTVRLDGADSRSVLIVQVLDAQTLHKLMRDRLGPGPAIEKVADFEMSVSKTPEGIAASFVDNNLLIGSAVDVRRCLEARAQANSLVANDPFRRAQQMINPSARTTTLTFTSDESAARSFVLLFSPDRTATLSGRVAALSDLSRHRPYTVTATELGESGLEQTSRSSFGQLGALLVRLTGGGSQ